MGIPVHILLLAGSLEAREIASALLDRVPVQAVLSEAERGVPALPVRHVTQQFADVQAFADFVQASGATAILDASHGFDSTLSDQGFRAAQQMGLAYLRVERPPWTVDGHPRWKTAASVAEAMPLVRPGTRVFATTGWHSQPNFAAFDGDTLLLRQTRNHRRPPLFDFVEPVFGLPPFTKASETQLFEEMGVDMLIARNLGGVRSRPKLDAADALGLDVVLIDRPAAPTGAQTVTDLDAALAWVAAL